MKAGCIGELVVDFISTKPADSVQEASLFQKCPGGSPANVAVLLHKQGISTTLISRVGAGQPGKYLLDAVSAAGLTLDAISVDALHPTRCVFMAYNKAGLRSVEIANRQSADQYMTMDQAALEVIGRLDLLHVGGTTILGELTGATVQLLVKRVKKHGGLVSLDPNINLSRISDAASARLRLLLPWVDILKVNEEEWEAIQLFLPPEHQPAIVVCTRGAAGASIITKSEAIGIPAIDTPVVDVTGAGDAYFAGFLAYLINNAVDPLNAPFDVLKRSGEHGAILAAQIIQFFGGALANHSL